MRIQLSGCAIVNEKGDWNPIQYSKMQWQKTKDHLL